MIIEDAETTATTLTIRPGDGSPGDSVVAPL
jgi:hypothetical protein